MTQPHKHTFTYNNACSASWADNGIHNNTNPSNSPTPLVSPLPSIQLHLYLHFALTFPFSMHFVNMTIVWTWFSQIILQNVARVFSVGPGRVDMVMSSPGTIHELTLSGNVAVFILVALMVPETVKSGPLRVTAYIDVAGIDVVRANHTWYLFQFHSTIIICNYNS